MSERTYVRQPNDWTLDDGRVLRLITPTEFSEMAGGTELVSIQGESVVKGRDVIDDDERFGYLAYGPVVHRVKSRPKRQYGDIWFCKIGDTANVPKGGDLPMRQAVQRAFREITGHDAEFCFSGWGASLTTGEEEVVERSATPAGRREPSDG